MMVFRIAATMADAFLALVSLLGIIGNRLNKEERNAITFCLITAIINIIVIWGVV